MLKWLANRQLNAFEKAFDYDISYMREMMDISWRGFSQFSSVAKLSAYCENLPPDAWHAARIAAMLAEDCGPCTQLFVRMAEQSGVKASVLRGILTGDQVAMGEDAALAFRFTDAVLKRDHRADALRSQVIARWGQQGMLTLALAIASSRIFPVVKFTMGHGQTCTLVKVDGDMLQPQLSTQRA